MRKAQQKKRTRALKIPRDIEFPAATRPLVSSVNLALSPEDLMHRGDDRHYLACGAGALNIILSVLNLSGVADPRSILDFGAGAGRVARWLRAAFPNAKLDACDVSINPLEFCRKEFGVRTSNGRDTYELIWAGSVATHFSESATKSLLDQLVSRLDPNGILIMSLNGRRVLQRHLFGESRIPERDWKKITGRLKKTGYGYAYGSEEDDRISVAKLSWSASLIEKRGNLRLLMLSENIWDNHQDILAVQKVQ